MLISEYSKESSLCLSENAFIICSSFYYFKHLLKQYKIFLHSKFKAQERMVSALLIPFPGVPKLNSILRIYPRK